MGVAFHKMHGLGNDFVVIDGRARSVALDESQVRRLADRREGVGCDQLILLEPSEVADARMRVFNADGGEVETCGNALRCVTRLLGDRARVETLGGIADGHATADGASIDLGEPRFDWQCIPLAYAMDTADMPVGWDGLERPAAVNVGNPHVVFFVDDAEAIPLDTLRPRIETGDRHLGRHPRRGRAHRHPSAHDARARPHRPSRLGARRRPHARLRHRGLGDGGGGDPARAGGFTGDCRAAWRRVGHRMEPGRDDLTHGWALLSCSAALTE